LEESADVVAASGPRQVLKLQLVLIRKSGCLGPGSQRRLGVEKKQRKAINPVSVRGLGLRAIYAIQKRSPRRLAAVLLARCAF
jgi:hypothetical protein